jgi:uncharacterized phiE125 gp8 family phage protein
MSVFALQRIGNTGTEPVSLADMKAQLNVDASFTGDDTLIGSMISAARSDAEDLTGECYATQQWLLALDWFPTYRVNESAPARSDFDALGNYNFSAWRWNHTQTIMLPRGPLLSVDSIQYTDLSGTLQTLDPSAYQADLISDPGRVLPAIGAYWPQVSPVANAVQIKFTAGYESTVTGANTRPIRPKVLMAIKLRAAAYYANREEFLAGVPSVNPDWFERILSTEQTQIFGYVGR